MEVGSLDANAADGGELHRLGIDLDAKDIETSSLRFDADRCAGDALHLTLRHSH